MISRINRLENNLKISLRFARQMEEAQVRIFLRYRPQKGVLVGRAASEAASWETDAASTPGPQAPPTSNLLPFSLLSDVLLQKDTQVHKL